VLRRKDANTTASSAIMARLMTMIQRGDMSWSVRSVLPC
jgi:hypothetical protein